MTITALLIDSTVLGSAATALLIASHLLRAPAEPAADGGGGRSGGQHGDRGSGGRGRRGGRGSAGLVRSPEVLLLAVTALLYLNQLLCAAYLLRVHGGDTGFVTRYLPPGWFDQPTGNPVVRALADHLPAPRLFAPTVLRVQAFLELPFVLLAYATVLRRLDPARYRTAIGSAPLLWSAAVSWTLVFGTVEWRFHNPWTLQDLTIRALSAACTTPLLLATARRAPAGPAATEPDPGPGTLGLLRFAAALWAVGTLVMVVYDTALLYNPAHLPTRWPEAALALLLLAATARRPTTRTAPGPATTALAVLLRRILVLFLVPALAVRYGLGFAHPQIAAAGALLVTAAALADRRIRAAAPQLALAGTVGLLAARYALHLTPDPYPETGLLRALVALTATTTLLCALADTLRTRIPGTHRLLTPVGNPEEPLRPGTAARPVQQEGSGGLRAGQGG
ncbi:hypothetical protein [Kitasatospora sp. NPDC088134]|uniref:hypothetical protein n=1 Tax=Kitasatospora sp. NPDC088134 TaxID=3364071 RepID=UPI003818138F